MRTSLPGIWAAGLVGALTLARPGAANIYAFIATNMPRTKPGSLTPQEVADVTAYLLKLNELPAGSTALPSDPAAAARVRFTDARPAR